MLSLKTCNFSLLRKLFSQSLRLEKVMFKKAFNIFGFDHSSSLERKNKITFYHSFATLLI